MDIDVSNVKTVYIDKLESETLVAVPGEEITPVFQYTGGWMHRYVYLDKGNDGKFQSEFVKKVPAPGSDLVSYSFLGEPDASTGRNSKGETTQNSTQDNPPAFIIPEDITPASIACAARSIGTATMPPATQLSLLSIMEEPFLTSL